MKMRYTARMNKQSLRKQVALGGLFLLVVLAGAYSFVSAFITPKPPQLSVVNVAEVGELTNPSTGYILRDGGASVPLGDKILWMFGDTLFARKSVDDKSNGRSNTAAYSTYANPTQLSEPLDKNGVPYQFIDFNAEELAYNRASGKPDERYAIWPGFMVPESKDSALVFYDRLKVHPGYLNYEGIGTGVARVRAGETKADRLVDNLFTGKGTRFEHAYVQRDGYTYLYGCDIVAGSLESYCRVARVRTGDILNRDKYSFWTGSAWVADLAQSKAVVPGSTSGFSVMYSESLKSYVSVKVPAFSKIIELRTAQRPEGPWSTPVTAYTAPSGIYAAYLHPELSKDNTLSISYYRDEGNWKGYVHLISVEVKADSK